jgi:hypothetical protein
MHTSALAVIALVFAGAAAAQEDVGAAGRKGPTPAPVDAAPPLRLPPVEAFRLFPQLAAPPYFDLAGLEDRRLFHQQGDPDSLFTLGAPTPGGEVHLKAAIEVNEIYLKAIAPDPLVSPSDTRPRAAGSFLPLDSQGRPYQLRLGARLVW